MVKKDQNPTPQIFYRYTIANYAKIGTRISEIKYVLVKETPRGYWMSTSPYGFAKRWIPKESKKRYAYPTKEEALVNLVKRTERRIEILEYQLSVAKSGLFLAERMEVSNSQ